MARTVATAYYLVGSLVFLIGVAPTGGYSLLRGTIRRRRPTGARNVLIIVVGVALFALGVLVDLTRPI
jgi:sulfite exporter TauE/SafE